MGGFSPAASATTRSLAARARHFVATVGDGNDSYTGGLGIDTYDLSGTSANATVTLALATAQLISAQAGTDTLVGIENVIGGTGNDRFVASVTGDGNNSYNGGLGTNTYDLSATTAAATVNLLTGTATSSQTGSDTLALIQNVIGGSGADKITGSAVGGVFTGGLGNDTVVGGAGNDTFVATIGVGNDGNDSYNGGTGIDTYDLSATKLGVTVNLNQGTGFGTEISTGTTRPHRYDHTRLDRRKHNREPDRRLRQRRARRRLAEQRPDRRCRQRRAERQRRCRHHDRRHWRRPIQR